MAWGVSSGFRVCVVACPRVTAKSFTQRETDGIRVTARGPDGMRIHATDASGVHRFIVHAVAE